MKKLLCVLLALMMTVFACIPAAAATDLAVSPLPGADLADDGDGVYTLTFTPPTEDFEDGYWFATSKDGEYEYVEETDPEKLADPEWLYENDYIYEAENDRYLLAKDIVRGFPENPVYYTIKKMPEKMAVNAGEIVTFKVKTSPKYNQTTVVVRANDINVQPNVKGEYSVLVNQDMTIRVVERGEKGDVLLRSHFFVYLPKGEEGEYRCRTLENTNYQVVYYGDSFDFRLVLGKDAVVNNLAVTVTRGKDVLSEELGFDPSAILGQIGIGNIETLTSYGTDASGARLYRVTDVTTDITINVSGIKTQESANTMNLIMRILRFILNLLGINLPFLQDMNATIDVSVQNNCDDVDYTVLQGATQGELNGNVYKVSSGDYLSLVVYKYDAEQEITVSWKTGADKDKPYEVEWKADYDQNKDRAYYYAIYNIDNITENTVVTIAPGA